MVLQVGHYTKVKQEIFLEYLAKDVILKNSINHVKNNKNKGGRGRKIV